MDILPLYIGIEQTYTKLRISWLRVRVAPGALYIGVKTLKKHISEVTEPSILEGSLLLQPYCNPI